jgi:hypothetical protein
MVVSHAADSDGSAFDFWRSDRSARSPDAKRFRSYTANAEIREDSIDTRGAF